MEVAELIRSLAPLEERWREMPITEELERVRWFPLSRVDVDSNSYLGLDSGGRWVLGWPWARDRERAGVVFDPQGETGALYLTPQLDRLPRTVMNEAVEIAELSGLAPVEVWDLFPWRYVIRCGILSARMQYVKPAVDWALHLAVLDDFHSDLLSIVSDRSVDAEWVNAVLLGCSLPWPRIGLL